MFSIPCMLFCVEVWLPFGQPPYSSLFLLAQLPYSDSVPIFPLWRLCPGTSGFPVIIHLVGVPLRLGRGQAGSGVSLKFHLLPSPTLLLSSALVPDCLPGLRSRHDASAPLGWGQPPSSSPGCLNPRVLLLSAAFHLMSWVGLRLHVWVAIQGSRTFRHFRGLSGAFKDLLMMSYR